MQDFREALAKLQEQFEVKDEKVNTIDIVEETNPDLTHESVAYKENKKFIFKQFISYENAQDIVESIRGVDGISIERYRERVNKACTSAWIMQESPVEMMIYATKGLKNQQHLNVVLDILKSFEEKDESFIASYTNILKNWNWNECIKTVLKSLQDLRNKTFSKSVYHIFETNEILRKEAGHTLIAMGEITYYESIINFLVMRSNDTRAQLEEIKELVTAMGNQSNEVSELIYKSYINMNMRLEVSNQLIPGIRKHISPDILKQTEQLLSDRHGDYIQQKKAIRFLERCDGNVAVKKVLEKVKAYEHLKSSWSNPVGRVMGLQSIRELMNSKGLEHKDTLNAILALGQAEDEKSKEILYTLSEKTELLKIFANSALAERGDKQRLVKLCTYIIEPNKDKELVNEAIKQIKRLRFIPNESLSKDLLSITKKLLETLESKANSENILRVLAFYEVGIPTDEIGSMYLNQFKISKHMQVQQMALEFLVKNHSRFSKILQAQINKEFIAISQNGTAFAKQVMIALGKIGNITDAVPVVRK